MSRHQPTIEEQRQRVEQLELQVEHLKRLNGEMQAALTDLYRHGIHADTTPTVSHKGMDTSWWYTYLHDADATVRRIALRGLGRRPL